MNESKTKNTYYALLDLGYEVLHETEAHVEMLRALDDGLITHKELEFFECYWTQIDAGIKEELAWKEALCDPAQWK